MSALTPFGWKVIGGGALVLILLIGWWQVGGAIRSWWVKRGIDQAQESGEAARQAIGAARAEAEQLRSERAAQLREIVELKRQRDRALAAASRERAEAARLTALAETIERKRRDEPRITTLVEARDAFKALGY